MLTAMLILTRVLETQWNERASFIVYSQPLHLWCPNVCSPYLYNFTPDIYSYFTHPQLVRYLLDINLNPSISKVWLGSDEVLCAGPVLVVEGHYEGSVSENGGLVDTVPTIRADHGPICGYRIVNTHRGKVPFEVN